MLKKIFVFCLCLLILTGCSKKTIEEVPDKYPNEFQIECQKNVDNYGVDKVTAISTAKAKFNDKGYLTWIEFALIETSADKKTYKERKKTIKENLNNSESNIKVIYNDKKRKITTSTELDIDYTDVSDKEKKELVAKKYIPILEDKGYVCEIIGLTRSEIPLPEVHI